MGAGLPAELPMPVNFPNFCGHPAKTPGRIYLILRPTDTSLSSQSGPTSYHIWRQMVFGHFCRDSFNKKDEKTRAIYKAAPIFWIFIYLFLSSHINSILLYNVISSMYRMLYGALVVTLWTCDGTLQIVILLLFFAV